MSRLDYVTIGIVVVCVIALAFLLYKTTNIFGGGTEQAAVPQNIYEDTTAIDPYAYDDYSDTSAILPATDEDPDDKEVKTYEDETSTADQSESKTGKTREIPSTPVETEATTTGGASTREGDYLVLAGAFKEKVNAQTEASRLRKLGYAHAEVSPFNRGTFAVVLVDRFVDVADARKLVNELKAKGVEAYVQEKREE